MNIAQNRAWPQESELDLTLLVACFNEEENILATLETLVLALSEFSFRWEILVVDDASTDRSVELIQEYQLRHPEIAIHLFVNEANQGFGYNYVQGAFLGRGEFYRVICGDNSEPLETHIEILKLMGTTELVVPYYMNDMGRSWFRQMLSWTYTALINMLSGYRLRYYNGLMLAPRVEVMRWNGNYRGFGIQADLLTRLLDEGLTYVEAGVWDYEKKHGRSTALKFKNVMSVLHTIIDISIRRVGKFLYPREDLATRHATRLRPHPAHYRRRPAVEKV